MTEVHFHGILAKKYGKVHKMALSKPKDLLLAMEANHDDFPLELKKLAQKNIHYSFIVNDRWVKNHEQFSDKIKKIDFVPCILGSGPAVFGFTLAQGILFWGSIALAIGSAVYSYVQAGKMEYPQIPGAEATSAALNRSLAFSNRENILEQGNPVPLVYGRLRVGSFVVQSTVKAFPLNMTLGDEFNNTSSKKSTNQSAFVDNSNSNLISTSSLNLLS
jgi:predicted phage tail protein